MEKIAEIIDTPHGRLYAPRHWSIQIGAAFGAFLGSLGSAELVAQILGDLSTFAEVVLYISFLGVFFLGYGLWTARLSAIAFEGVGRGILKALVLLILRRRKPQSLEEIFPQKEKLLEMLVRAQRAAWSFLTAGITIAVPAGLAGLLFDSALPAVPRLLVICGGLVAWGDLLGFLGRRSVLPLPEGE